MGRTPDFSVRRMTGPAGVEGEGRAASFELPSPSLSSKKAPSSRLLDLQVGPRLLERLRRTSFLRLPRRRPPRPHTPAPRSAPRPRAPSPAAAPHRRAPRLRAIAAAAPSAPRRDPSPGPAPRRRASRLRATAAAARPRAVAVAAARPRAAARLRAAAAAGSLPAGLPSRRRRRRQTARRRRRRTSQPCAGPSPPCRSSRRWRGPARSRPGGGRSARLPPWRPPLPYA